MPDSKHTTLGQMKDFAQRQDARDDAQDALIQQLDAEHDTKNEEQDEQIGQAVKYTEQTLTDEQKAQARENIGAMKNLNGYANQIVGFDTDGNAIARSAIEFGEVTGNTNKIYWDGVIGDKTAVSASVTQSSKTHTYTFVRVYDTMVDVSNFESGYTLGKRTDTGIESYTSYSDASNITNPATGVHCINGLVYLVGTGYVGDAVPVTIMYKSTSITFPGVGVYFVSYDDSGSSLVAASAMSIESPILSVDVSRRKLKEEYLPESAALKSDIPTDDHINELINTALGVIENGTY